LYVKIINNDKTAKQKYMRSDKNNPGGKTNLEHNFPELLTTANSPNPARSSTSEIQNGLVKIQTETMRCEAMQITNFELPLSKIISSDFH